MMLAQSKQANMSHFFHVCVLLLFSMMLTSCNGSNSNSASKTEMQPKSIVSTEKKLIDMEKPFIAAAEKALKTAWESLIGDGRYRLAHVSDMEFSEAAKERINLSFSLWQGDKTFRNELAILIVNTTKVDRKRFSFVIFRPLGKKSLESPISYKIFWLLKDQDLSKAAVNRVSGDLSIVELNDIGGFRSRRVSWNEKQQKYDLSGKI